MKKQDTKGKSSGTAVENVVEKAHIKRRKVLGGITASAAATGVASSGGVWIKPVIDGVVLPAHAETSAVACDMTASAAIRMGSSGDRNGAVDGYIDDTDFTSDFADGTHNFGSDDDDFGIISQFSVKFAAPVTEQVDATLDLVFSGDWDTPGGDSNVDFPSQKVTLSPGATGATFTSVGGIQEDDLEEAHTMTGTMKSAGCPTRRISFVISDTGN